MNLILGAQDYTWHGGWIVELVQRLVNDPTSCRAHNWTLLQSGSHDARFTERKVTHERNQKRHTCYMQSLVNHPPAKPTQEQVQWSNQDPAAFPRFEAGRVQTRFGVSVV